ncbi:MAG: c-type cytochrome biogenesis protein CcsB [Armatimonadota bacterium]
MTVENGALLFSIASWMYLGSAICYIIYLFNRNAVLAKVGTWILVSGGLAHTTSLVLRTIAAERPPFLNLYEYVLSLTWAFMVVYLFVQWKTKNRDIGALAVPLLSLFTYLAMRLPTEVNPTMPALRSAWRIPHIATAIFAYACFGIAFGLAIMYLIRKNSEGNKNSFWVTRLPSLEVIDRLIYRLTAFGFMMQTALLITGAIWAQWAWGRYWGWDPKETWGLVTWIIYAAYLHTRVTMGWKGTKSAITIIIGFIAVMFTLFGVNYLGGLHSYGSN